jgi:hypothetical protein
MILRTIASTMLLGALTAGAAGASISCGNGATRPNAGISVPAGEGKDDAHEVIATNLVTAMSPEVSPASHESIAWPVGWVYATKKAGFYFSPGNSYVPISSDRPADVIAGYKKLLAALGEPLPKEGPFFDVLRGTWHLQVDPCLVPPIRE